jgi:hypothetical protein
MGDKLNRLRKVPAILMVGLVGLLSAACHVAVPGTNGNKIHRDGSGNVTMLEYGHDFLDELYDGDLDNKCVDGVTGADIGTPDRTRLSA